MAKEITYPLGLKFAMIIMAICLVMGLVIVAFGYRLFADQNHQQYTDHGRTLVTASSKYVNWDNINHYLETGETDEEYATTLENLQVFAEAAGAEYLYVLVPTEEGNLYVYDSDPSTGHIVLGETIAREEEYDQLTDELFAGEQFDPVVSDGEYGELFAVYLPMHDSSGNFVAYMGVDFSVEHIKQEQYDFAKRLIAMAVGIAIVITLLFVALLNRMVVGPINQIAVSASEYLVEVKQDYFREVNSITKLEINTKDELQSLSESIKSMVIKIDQYMNNLKEVNEKASKDPLTSLLNREAFREKASSVIVKDHSSDTHAFLMIDLDNFKNINDTYGHSVGDEVLIACAKAIKSKFRTGDLIARLGGDEFAVFYKNLLKVEDIERRAQSICSGIASLSFKEGFTVRASIGIAYSKANKGNSYQRLYMIADEALYEAKENGRNTYVVIEDTRNRHE